MQTIMNNKIKSLSLVGLLVGSVVVSEGASATPFNLLQGAYQITGNSFVDNDYNQGPGDTRGARGIAEVIQITNGATIVWDRTTATQEYNLVFDGYEIVSTGVFGTTRNFESIAGFVGIYDNALGTFAATGDFTLDTASITSGIDYLLLGGHGSAFGSINAVAGTDVSFQANGLLDVLGGTEGAFFDNDLLADGSDLSFQLSADNIDTQGYSFSGSSDLGGTIPEPGSMALLGLGLIGLSRIKKTATV